MMSKQKRNFLPLAFSLFIISLSHAQVTINTMVADSATLLPLSDVSIRLKNSLAGTITNTFGYFTISAAATDTLIFSRVGYFTKEYSVEKLKETIVVYLTEELLLLSPVTITGTMLVPGLENMSMKSPWQNTSANPGADIPGFQGLSTFGPGYVAPGIFSNYTREEKEKKKLQTVREENNNAKTYVQILHDPELKDFLIKEYSLTEGEIMRYSFPLMKRIMTSFMSWSKRA